MFVSITKHVFNIGFPLHYIITNRQYIKWRVKEKKVRSKECKLTWKSKNEISHGIVEVNSNPSEGFASKAIGWLEKLSAKLMYDSSQPHHYLSGNFAPVVDETPPCQVLLVHGHLPECLNGEFFRVGPNPKFIPSAGYHWMIHGMHVKDGKATYVSRYVRTSRVKQEKYFRGSMCIKLGNLKGLFGIFAICLQMLKVKLKVLDTSYGNGTANTTLIYHHGKLLALSEIDKPYVLRVLEDGDLQTLGLLDYNKRLTHSFTAHPKVDPLTGEMFTFGYSQSPPYITYRVVSKDSFMHGPVPITIPAPIMMHDFAITENYAIIMDLPLYFRPKEMVKEKKTIFNFDSTKKARFGVLPRYATNESLIKWFELPNCFIFHNANAWEGDEVVLITCRIENVDLDVLGGAVKDVSESFSDNLLLTANAWEGDEVVLITCRIENVDLDVLGGAVKDVSESFSDNLYEMRFNIKTGLASQRKLSASAVDFPRINENYTGRRQRYVYGAIMGSIAKIKGIVKFDLHAEPDINKTEFEVGGTVQGIFDLGPERFGSEAIFVPCKKGTASEEDDGFLIFFVHDENTGKSSVNVIDAKTMSADPVAVVELPNRVSYGFHALFVTEEQLQEQIAF